LQDPAGHNLKVIHLCGLLWLEKQGFIKLYYGDETRVSMNSYLPSAWQEKGSPTGIVPNRAAGLNVFGLLGRDMDFHPYTTKQNMDSALTIAFIDHFLGRAPPGPKVIVLDNAAIHHSEEFDDQAERWEEEGLFIFYLPKYSPHLNLIETLWRKIKYEWLKQHNFISMDCFFAGLEYVLLNIGKEFRINFKDQLLPN
jgi:transposase